MQAEAASRLRDTMNHGGAKAAIFLQMFAPWAVTRTSVAS